jgi:AAA ATPase-like protein
VTTRDRQGSASLEEGKPSRERTATVVAVAIDCSPAALRTALAGHAGEVVRREGVLLAAFDSVGVALDAAVSALQRSGEERAPRIGLAHGDVVARDFTLSGPAADAAFALQGRASRREVLVDDVVRALAEHHAFVRRGVDEPGVWSLVSHGDDDGVPLPPVLAPGRARWPFVGRETELAAIRSQLATLARGERRAFLLAGEPGIGKTRLAAEVGAAAHAAGAVVLYGRSDEGAGIPYQPFAEALGHYVANAPERVALPVAGARELATLVPALTPDTLAGEPAPARSGERYVLFAAVAALLTAASAPTPVVLVLDDVHWADEPTVLLLRHLMNAPGSLRLLVLAGYRPGGVARGSALATALGELGRDERVTTLTLGGLGDAQIVTLVEEAAGGELDPRERAFADALHRDTGGNPLFAGELLRGIGDRDALRDAARRLADADALSAPPSVRDLIEARAARLGDAARAVLEAAAVIGPEFDVEILAAALAGAAGAGAAELARIADALDAAVAAELIVPTDGAAGGFTFRHTLIRTTLYEAQGAAARGLLHRRAAEALEARDDASRFAAASARHWGEALPPDRERALRWAELAGRDALDRLEPHAAVGWFERALELHGDAADRRRAELLIGLGSARRQRGEPAFRETLLDAARLANELGETELLVAAALANTRGFVSASGTVDEERVATLRAALAALGDGDSRERALLLAILAAELSFAPGFEQRLALSDDAVAVARRLGDAATLCRVLSARFVPIWVPETLQERLDGAAESVAIADELGDPLTQFAAIHWHGVGLVQAGRMEEAIRAVQREHTLAARLGEPTARWLAAYDEANLAIVAGRLEQAEQLAQTALELGTESGQPDAFPFHANQLTNIRHEQGRLAELQPMIAEVVTANPGIPGFRALLALACTEGDLQAEAARLLADEPLAELPRDVAWLAAQVIWAHVCAAVGDAERAGEQYERLAPFAEQIAFTGVSAWGDVDHALGRLAALRGAHDMAARHFGASTERYARAGAPVWLARVALDEAAMRIARGGPGDAEHARTLLGLAEDEGRRLGAAQIERRARALREHERASALLGAASRAGRTRLGGAAVRSPHAAAARGPGAASAAGDAAAPGGGGPTEGAALARSGDLWTLRSSAGEFHLKDAKGLGYLVRLLAHPHVEVHVLDLQSGGAAEPGAAEGADALAADDAGALLDPQAKRAYRLRLEDLAEQIAEAERFNDPERAAGAVAERDAIAHELAAAVGLGGRDRRAASAAERARVNATRALRKAIGRIGDHDPALGAHLDRAVRTGTFCAYDPAPREAIRWELTA